MYLKVTSIKTTYSVLKKTFIIILTLVFFSSCAIHKKFPFICFRFECVKAQLKFPNIRAAIKRNKGIAQAKRRKKYGASQESSRIKEITKPTVNRSDDESTPHDTRKDSVFTFTPPAIKPREKEDQDTLIIFNYYLYEDVISEENKSDLKNYITRIGASKISQIKIKGYADAAENRHHTGMDLLRAKKLYKLLGKYGVPSSKMIILENPPEGQTDLKRTIEIRVQ